MEVGVDFSHRSEASEVQQPASTLLPYFTLRTRRLGWEPLEPRSFWAKLQAKTFSFSFGSCRRGSRKLDAVGCTTRAAIGTSLSSFSVDLSGASQILFQWLRQPIDICSTLTPGKSLLYQEAHNSPD